MEYQKMIDKANILIEALPYIQQLAGKTIVIKCGGNAMGDETVTDTLLQDITLLKFVGANPVVVHGGGPEINKMLELRNIELKFHKGLRITDAATMETVQMVLVGKINKDLVARINSLGGNAIGLCGQDAGLIRVKKLPVRDGVDYGFVGSVTDINTSLIQSLCQSEYIPVIAPIGAGADGNSYNINADTVAGEIAAAMRAEKLMFLTDIDGVRMDPQNPDSLMSIITVEQIYRLIEQKIISGGMIPKVMGCITGIEQGVRRTHIINGTIPHSIVLEIFTDRGIGTMVTK